MSDKDLIKLSDDHQILVTNLREALLVGQEGFLKAGAILSEIKEKETYKSEDEAHEWTWNDFMARPDLPFPGRTPESRRRTADALIRIYKTFKEKFGFETDVLAPIGCTKLYLLAGTLKGEDSKDVVNEWLDKAKELTTTDLALEIKGGDKEIGEGLTCLHPDAYQVWYCSHCGSKTKDRP